MESSKANTANSEKIEALPDANAKHFVFLRCFQEQGHTYAGYDFVRRRHIFIDVLSQRDKVTLLDFYEENEFLGFLPLLPLRIVHERPLSGDAIERIWNIYLLAETSVPLLDSDHIAEVNKSGSRAMLTDLAAGVVAMIIRFLYAKRIGSEDIEAVLPLSADDSGNAPDWLQFASYRAKRNLRDWFDAFPWMTKLGQREYWRAAVTIALHHLTNQGIDVFRLDRNQLEKSLNDYIFEDENFTCLYDTLLCSAEALAARFVDIHGFAGKAKKELEEYLGLRNRPRKYKLQPEFLTFEREGILPIGDVEEYIKTIWNSSSESDLEILQPGFFHESLVSNPAEIREAVEDAIKEWGRKKRNLKNIRENWLKDPLHSYGVVQWVAKQLKALEEDLLSNYGIDIANRRVPDRAKLPKTPEDMAKMAFNYVQSQVLTTAKYCADFNFDWYEEEFTKGGKDVFAAKEAAIMKAAFAAYAVWEAEHLFHIEVLDRTQNPIVQVMEQYVLSGIGAQIRTAQPNTNNWRLRMTREQKLERLPGAVWLAAKERRSGDALIAGRGSFRNLVAKYLDEQGGKSNGREILFDTASLDAINKGIPVYAKQDPVLTGEARAKAAKEIAAAHLSPQERSVMKLKILEGKSNNEIASALNKSRDQVNVLRKRAYQKAPHLRRNSPSNQK